MSYQLQLGNMLFHSIHSSPARELLDVELASDHNIEVQLVRSALDRYVASDWLTTQVRPKPMKPNESVVLFKIVEGYQDRPLQRSETPIRRKDDASAAMRAARESPKPQRKTREAPKKKTAVPAPAPAVAVSSDAVPSDPPMTKSTQPVSPPVEPAKPEPSAAAPSEKNEMPRGQYERKPKQPGEAKATPSTSFSFSDDELLLIRANGKSVELDAEQVQRLVAYMRRIGLIYEVGTLGEFASSTLAAQPTV